MYPYIELNIKNNIVNILFYSSETDVKQLNLDTNNIVNIAQNVALDLELIESNANNDFNALLEIARNSNETYFNELPELNDMVEVIDLENSANKFLQRILQESVDEYKDVNASPNVLQELKQNRNSDIFASLMDGIYNILISKTLILASELGIGKIALNDEFKNSRLMEKMSSELAKMDLDLIVN